MQRDVDICANTIRVMGKGGKELVVPFGNRTLKALLRYMAVRTDEYADLWVSEARRPICGYVRNRACSPYWGRAFSLS